MSGFDSRTLPGAFRHGAPSTSAGEPAPIATSHAMPGNLDGSLPSEEIGDILLLEEPGDPASRDEDDVLLLEGDDEVLSSEDVGDVLLLEEPGDLASRDEDDVLLLEGDDEVLVLEDEVSFASRADPNMEILPEIELDDWELEPEEGEPAYEVLDGVGDSPELDPEEAILFGDTDWSVAPNPPEEWSLEPPVTRPAPKASGEEPRRSCLAIGDGEDQ